MHYGKGLISVFQDFLVSINKSFILAVGLGIRLSFYDRSPIREEVIGESGATR